MVDKVYKIKDVFNLFVGGDVNRTHFSEYKTSTYIFCIYSNSLADHGLYGYTDVPKYSGDSITITGRGSIGHAEYRPFDFDAIIRLLVLIPKDKDIIDSRYVTELINSYVKFPLESTGVPQLTVPQIENIEISLPAIEVQRKIANALSDVDGMISSLEKLVAKYKSIKTACLQQMFPQNGETVPRMRLPGFTGAWEQRKFEEIAVRSSVICSDDTLPRVEYEDIVSGTGRLNKDIYAKQSSKSGIAFHQGDVLYGKLRPYLQNWLLPTFDGLAVGDFWVLQPQNADSSFLYRLIQSRQFDEVANQSTGTKMPRADWKLVSKTVFSIPSNISEQAAIGTYFTALDSLITLHQRKLEKIQKIKQGMMQQLLTGKIRLV